MRLGQKHAPKYRTLMLLGYKESGDAFTSSLRERGALPISWWRDRLDGDDRPSSIVFGAFREDALVGVAGLARNTNDKTRHKARLFGMYVHPEFRGHGIAAQLLDEALGFARSDPVLIEVQLTVTAGNAPAQRLYEGAGFTQYGIEPRAISSPHGYLDKIQLHLAIDPQLQ